MFYADLLVCGSLDGKNIRNISKTIMIWNSDFLRADYSSVLYASDRIYIFRQILYKNDYEIYF